MTQSVNEQLRSEAVKHSVYLQRYSNNTARKMLKLMAAVDGDIVAQLQKLDAKIFANPNTIERLNGLLTSVRIINKDVYNQLYNALKDDLSHLSGHELDFQTGLLDKTLNIPVVSIIPASAAVYAATVSQPFQGKLLREWVDGMEAGAFDRLKSAIRIGVVEGETVEKIVQRVKGTRAMGYADGVLEISRRSAEALVRTAVSHTVNSARSQVYQANESIMKGVQWVSTLDGRTSAVCQSRDGTVYPVNSGPRPPAHINCRSSTCPVIKSWQELGINMKDLPEGTRASMNGQVSEKETYQTWLGKQSAAFQDDVLGPTKGKLFREGGVTLDRFVDRNGASLTIDQLRAKEAPAFKRAGV
jgi:SPP1 gp7 family putative phage head morphogenesis protein